MKAIILAAGYATRLYPLTLDKPKPLLQVGGKTILDHILFKIEVLDEVDQIYIITNDKFYPQFSKWKNPQAKKKCTIISDGTAELDQRLGAIGDIRFVIEKAGISDDCMILAGDNLFNFDLSQFVSFFKKKGSCVACYELGDLKKAAHFGVIQLGENQRILKFLEKPKNPPCSLISMGIYCYTAQDLLMIEDYFSEGRSPDAPGYFLEWLSKKKEVYGCVIEGDWFDIGDIQSLRNAENFYRKDVSKERIE